MCSPGQSRAHCHSGRVGDLPSWVTLGRPHIFPALQWPPHTRSGPTSDDDPRTQHCMMDFVNHGSERGRSGEGAALLGQKVQCVAPGGGRGVGPHAQGAEQH